MSSLAHLSRINSDRVAVVTGAARGIGLAIAQWFLTRGWRVVLLDIDRETLGRTAASMAGCDQALALACDVSDPAQVESASTSILDRLGRVDAL
ncbi:MAG: SDR family NAD(P)-dependent oxidoreductase, partial [Actinobacteria bacterium]|nr:SDR family NAD(P)-dependent oxidoreductase [Actinomycetota bacterium]